MNADQTNIREELAESLFAAAVAEFFAVLAIVGFVAAVIVWAHVFTGGI